MKHIFTAILLQLGFTIANGQVKNPALPAKYEAVADFTSICCGTSSDDFLKTFVKNFNKKNKQKVVAYQQTGCGREGEFKVMLSLSKLSKTNKTKFITALKKLVTSQNKTIAAAGQNKGTVSLSYDQLAADIQNCRGAIEKWDFN
jgi:Cdc6-like AAA superfamily ATPase